MLYLKKSHLSLFVFARFVWHDEYNDNQKAVFNFVRITQRVTFQVMKVEF